MTAVSSAALLAAWTAAFRTLIRILLTSIIQIRQTAAKRKRGIPMDASAVTLPLFVPDADTLSISGWVMPLFVCFFIAVNFPFLRYLC